MHKEIKLDNNLTVVYERLEHVRAVSFGVWVGAGSRNETPDNNGISHFIEHMLFKGTGKRSAKQIAFEFDGIGGQINAFTSKDCTCFYTKTLDSDLELSMEILSDMLFNSTFDKVSLNTERKVVFEEINMYEDEPEEMVHDILDESVWSGSTLGYAILGTRGSLNGIHKKTILSYMESHYHPQNSVLSVVGNFDEARMLSLVETYFGAWRSKASAANQEQNVVFQPGMIYKHKKTEQTHICIGFEGVNMGDEEAYTLLVLNNILGGGMSSRLFQTIREEKGLVYSIYSYPTSFRDVGLFSIYAGTNPDKADEVVQMIRAEMDLLLEKGIDQAELSRSKNQLKGSFMLSLDSVSGRMTALGKSKLITGMVKTPEEILNSIDQVDQLSVHAMAKKLFKKGRAGMAILGPNDLSPPVRELFI